MTSRGHVNEGDSMKKMITRIFFAAAIVAAPLALACDYPARPPQPPDGTTATNDEMLAGVKIISGYQAAMADYLACIEADKVIANNALDDGNNETQQQRERMFNMKYNAAIDEQTLVVEELNAQIRAFKAR